MSDDGVDVRPAEKRNGKQDDSRQPEGRGVVGAKDPSGLFRYPARASNYSETKSYCADRQEPADELDELEKRFSRRETSWRK